MNIRTRVDFKWNENAAQQITRDVMQNLARQGEGRLRTVTCPIHGSMHQVVWEWQGEKINVSVADACCDELEQVLYREAERAIQ